MTCFRKGPLMVVRPILPDELGKDLFSSFIRHQTVTDCWRKDGGSWVIRRDAFIDDWSDDDYSVLIHDLKSLLDSGGTVIGAFIDDRLKGFAAVDGSLKGSASRYADLTELHVSEDMRRRGIGRVLFFEAAAAAKRKGAERLYISAHSAAETQSFYRGLGCRDAGEILSYHAEKEPYDCQFEYLLQPLPDNGN